MTRPNPAIEAAAKRIFVATKDQPWEAASFSEEAEAVDIARRSIAAALTAALHNYPSVIEAAANAISESSGMRFDGFWSRIEDLEPEDREYALLEARAALAAAFTRLQEPS